MLGANASKRDLSISQHAQAHPTGLSFWDFGVAHCGCTLGYDCMPLKGLLVMEGASLPLVQSGVVSPLSYSEG